MSVYHTVDGRQLHYPNRKPGPKPAPELRKKVLSLRLLPATLARVDAAAEQAGTTRQDWIERVILGGLCNTQSV